MVDSAFWAKMHGGMAHFPIALLISSALFDLIGYVINRESTSRGLHSAAFYTVILGALGSLGSVFSGLMLTGWQVWGTGALLKHHCFVWPAFGLLIGLAVWRITVREQASRKAFGVYLVVALAASGLMATAGYWGGELWLGA